MLYISGCKDTLLILNMQYFLKNIHKTQQEHRFASLQMTDKLNNI